jgi:hypothetical protein
MGAHEATPGGRVAWHGVRHQVAGVTEAIDSRSRGSVDTSRESTGAAFGAARMGAEGIQVVVVPCDLPKPLVVGVIRT